MLGTYSSSKGLKPNPEKLRAITEMPTPVNAKAVRYFIGMMDTM